MALTKIVNGVEETMSAEEETAFLAHREELKVKQDAEDAAVAKKATDKANAKAKLIAGEALTEAEADTIVL